MTQFGIPYLRVCINCHDEFSPIEGNDEGEFCSYSCEEEHFLKENGHEELNIDTAAQVYLEDYGKAPPWLK